MTTPIIVTHKASCVDLSNCIVIDDHKIIPSDGERVIVLVEYGELVSDEWLERVMKNGNFVYNIHRAWPGEYRGASVLNHQILEDKEWVTVTIQRLIPYAGIDQGPMVDTYPVLIRGKDYTEAVKSCRKTYTTLIEAAVEDSQRYSGKLYRRRKPEDSELLESDDAQTIFRKLRAANPDDYPCYFMQDGRKFYTKLFTPESPSAEECND